MVAAVPPIGNSPDGTVTTRAARMGSGSPRSPRSQSSTLERGGEEAEGGSVGLGSSRTYSTRRSPGVRSVGASMEKAT